MMLRRLLLLLLVLFACRLHDNLEVELKAYTSTGFWLIVALGAKPKLYPGVKYQQIESHKFVSFTAVILVAHKQLAHAMSASVSLLSPSVKEGLLLPTHNTVVSLQLSCIATISAFVVTCADVKLQTASKPCESNLLTGKSFARPSGGAFNRNTEYMCLKKKKEL